MSPKKKISVLIVDDSAFMRKALKRMLNSDPLIEVVGQAVDGEEALKKVRDLKPDVVTMDIRMPKMDGLRALEIIMKENPTPVLMVSSLTTEGGGVTLKALELGAVDFVDKSSCHTQMDIIELADSLLTKVKAIAKVDVIKFSEAPITPEELVHIEEPPKEFDIEQNPSHIVAIGSSTGGPMSLERVLTPLPATYPGAIMVVQHMPVGFTKSLSERLDDNCNMTVREAKEDNILSPGSVYIAPGGYHLKMKENFGQYQVVLTKEPNDSLHRPSVDVMMESISQTWPGRVLGVILTGMGADGSEGIKFIAKRKTNRIIAQDEETSVIYGMPKSAFLTGCVNTVLPLNQISKAIYEFSR